jgi:hypothetical protein
VSSLDVMDAAVLEVRAPMVNAKEGISTPPARIDYKKAGAHSRYSRLTHQT